jgi:hypothetical protein
MVRSAAEAPSGAGQARLWNRGRPGSTHIALGCELLATYSDDQPQVIDDFFTCIRQLIAA